MGPETQDFPWDPRPETRDPSHRWEPGPQSRDPEGETRDPRPGTHFIGGTQHPKGWTQDSGP